MRFYLLLAFGVSWLAVSCSQPPEDKGSIFNEIEFSDNGKIILSVHSKWNAYFVEEGVRVVGLGVLRSFLDCTGDFVSGAEVRVSFAADDERRLRLWSDSARSDCLNMGAGQINIVPVFEGRSVYNSDDGHEVSIPLGLIREIAAKNGGVVAIVLAEP